MGKQEKDSDMNTSMKFIRFASVCCFLSVITTLGIHLFFPDPPADFEQRILLFKDKVYLINRWWVIFHCLLVIVSMWGIALIKIKTTPGFTGIGFLFYAVFGIAEIFRQLFVLFYMNGLREQFYVATDPAAKEVLRNTLTNASLLASPLFGLFILAFGIGNLCYGLSFYKKPGWDRILSVLLILWSIGNFLALGNNFWQIKSLDAPMEIYSYTYQPLMRILLAMWLWKAAGFARQMQ
jgi:hypothetical protein